MSEVIVVAVLRAGEGNTDAALAALKEVAGHTHGESGCLTYALHRDVNDPQTIVLVERWRSKGDLDAHMGQSYVAKLADSAHLLDGPASVHVLEPLPTGDPLKGMLGANRTPGRIGD